jgi:hypothetical protein
MINVYRTAGIVKTDMKSADLCDASFIDLALSK